MKNKEINEKKRNKEIIKKREIKDRNFMKNKISFGDTDLRGNLILLG